MVVVGLPKALLRTHGGPEGRGVLGSGSVGLVQHSELTRGTALLLTSHNRCQSHTHPRRSRMQPRARFRPWP